MQDEVNTKVVAIMIKGGKISAEVLKKALDKFVQEIEKAQKQMQQPKTYRGKQSIKHLMGQNAAISNIEVTDGNIKSFERTASKYGLDFALKKDVSVEPPSYLVFFKGRDVDVMTAAFKEFSAKTVKQKEQPSSGHDAGRPWQGCHNSTIPLPQRAGAYRRVPPQVCGRA